MAMNLFIYRVHCVHECMHTHTFYFYCWENTIIIHSGYVVNTLQFDSHAYFRFGVSGFLPFSLCQQFFFPPRMRYCIIFLDTPIARDAHSHIPINQQIKLDDKSKRMSECIIYKQIFRMCVYSDGTLSIYIPCPDPCVYQLHLYY